MSKITDACKLHLFCFLAAVALLPACSKTEEQAAPETAATHTLGKKLTVYNYPLENAVLKKVAVHTYPVAIDNSDKRWAWPALGGKSGGTVLADTTTQCDKDCIDVSTVNYVMSEAPCIWPYDPYYAVVGVCWNATNRGLYYTGKTVHKVKFYVVIESYFGTYGLDTNSSCFRQKCRDGRKLYAWSKCQQAAAKNYPWHGRTQGELTAAGETLDPRIRLFESYFGEQAEPQLRALEPKARQAQYLSDLFNLNIDQKLGADFSADKRQQLNTLRLQLSASLQSLEAPDDNHDAYLQAFNNAVNQALRNYAEVLSDEEYFALLNATKEEVFDIRIRQ